MSILKKIKGPMFFNIYTAKKNVFQALRLDSAITKYQTKLKEGMYINWEKPNLNKQKNHLSTTLSI